MAAPLRAFHFPAGGTAFFRGKRQVSRVQRKGWLEVWCEYLETLGYDPSEVEIMCPGGFKAKAKKVRKRWTWEMQP